MKTNNPNGITQTYINKMHQIANKTKTKMSEKTPIELLNKAAEKYALLFHDTYEKLAPKFGYETRRETESF